jgi:aldehyde:ferredoxin oxidoreductase
MLPLHSINVLTVNLSTGEIKGEEIKDETFLKKYVGGLGIATYFLMKRYGPFVEDSPIIFAPGSLTGTSVPSSGRMSVVFKSPVTGRFFKANVGGYFGNQLKRSGIDLLIVEGKAEKPVYINIHDDKVEIKNASHLWGKDVRETNRIIREELDNAEVQIVCIGPAGENEVMYASLQVSIYNSAARGGIGALFGNKKLKAITARGSLPVEVAEPERFNKVAKTVTEKLFTAPGVRVISDFGTSPESDALNLFTACHFRNFQDNYAPKEILKTLTGNYLVNSGLLKRRIGCYSCPIGCHRFVTIEDGPYKGTYTGGPEYETIAAFGPLKISPEAVVKAAEMCSILGLDTISTGSCIQWLFESKQKGAITDKLSDGLDLSWGKEETVITLIKKIAYRNGIGKILSEGTRKASEKLGSDSYKWAIQSRGLEQSSVDTRFAMGYALAFAVNPRGPDHLHTECLAEFGGDSESERIISHITGSEEFAYAFTTDKRAEIVRWHEDIYAVSDCMGMCAFSTTAQFWMGEEDLAELFSAATGIEISLNEIMEVGRRIITLQRLYNVMLGITREDDILPFRFMNEVKTVTIKDTSPIAKRIPETKEDFPKIYRDKDGTIHITSIDSKEVLDKMKDEYYRLHEWDLATGWPTIRTLRNLDLDEFIPVALNNVKLPVGGEQ